jgi:threonine dehydrogenase-like Zn-dependent dehydrogenase
MVGVVKELSIQFVLGYDPMEFAGTLHAIAEGRLDVGPLVSATVGVEGVPAAFDALARPDEQVKILVEPRGPAVPTAP